MNPFQTDSSRWLAVQSRNPSAADAFVYCVKTTGIVCRPTCKARLARRSNVSFHNNYIEAKAAGFRACKRCKPEVEVYDPQADVVAQACRTIEQAGSEVGLGELAAKAGWTKSYFHRTFKKVMGVTPKMYGIGLIGEKELRKTTATNAPDITSTLLSSTESNELPSSHSSSASCDNGRGAGFPAPDFLFLETVPATSREVTGDNYYSTASSSSDRSDLIEGIEYTIQPWETGFVLIAVNRTDVCWLEAGHTISELSESLVRQFPQADIKLSTWSSAVNEATFRNSKHDMFLNIMEGLVNPSGKTMNLPFDVRGVS